MKISNLTEMATPSSMPDNNTAAPKFGRSDEMLESGVGTSTAGGVASVSKPMGKMRTRGQGSMFKGISTSSKYANSAKAGISEDSVNEDELSEEQLQAKKRREENFKKAKDRELGNKPKSRDIMAKEAFNGEYDDEAGMADNNLETMRRAVDGIDDVIGEGDNLPEWCQEKIAVAKSMLVTVWDYMRSEEEISEGPDNYGNNRTGFSKPKRDLSGEGEPEGMFMVMIDGRPWKEFTSNMAFQRAKTLATKYPTKKIQVKWPTGQLNTVTEGVAEEEDKMDSRFKKTEWMPLMDAIKILKHYGATTEEYMGHEIFPYYDIEGNRKYLEDITWNADNSKNVRVSLVNQAVRELKAQKQGVAEDRPIPKAESGKAIALSNLGKFHAGVDTLGKWVPERLTHQFALDPDKWEHTFYSLTLKEPKKIRYYRPKNVDILPGTLVGDMAIANQFYRTKDPVEQEKYALAYLASLKPYPVNLDDYKFPELLIPRKEQGVAEGLGKDIKRLATGKDVKSRAGQEIAKSQDASMKGDTKTSKKHFDRYDKLDKLANKEQGVAEESKGLWANIHAKRERIKQGSGERMRKPGSDGAPTASALRKSAK